MGRRDPQAWQVDSGGPAGDDPMKPRALRVVLAAAIGLTALSLPNAAGAADAGPSTNPAAPLINHFPLGTQTLSRTTTPTAGRGAANPQRGSQTTPHRASTAMPHQHGTAPGNPSARGVSFVLLLLAIPALIVVALLSRVAIRKSRRTARHRARVRRRPDRLMRSAPCDPRLEVGDGLETLLEHDPNAGPQEETERPQPTKWARQWALDSGLLLFSQVQILVATTAIAIVLARSLGPTNWALFSSFLGISQAATLVINFGLDTWLLRELSAMWARQQDFHQKPRHDFASAVYEAALVVSVLSGVLVAVAIPVGLILGLGVSVTFLLAALVGYTGLLAVSRQFEVALQARRRYHRLIVVNVVDKATLLALVAVALLTGWGLVGVGVAHIIAGSVRLLTASVRSMRGYGGRRPDWRAFRIMRTSAPFAANTAALNVLPRLDTPIVALTSTVAAGYYAVSDRVVQALFIIPTVAGTTLFPHLSHESTDRRTATIRVAALLGAVGLVLAIAGYFVVPKLLPLLFGQQYRAAVPVTQAEMLTMPFVFASNGVLAGLYTGRREGRSVLRTGPASLIGSVALLVGALLDGAVGAALGASVRQMLILVALTSLIPKRGDVGSAVVEADIAAT
jgi:O-antigen/teichoic acid export membrane protein